MVVAGGHSAFPFKRVPPFDNRFGIFFLQVLNLIVQQQALFFFIFAEPWPANQVGFPEIVQKSESWDCIENGYRDGIILKMSLEVVYLEFGIQWGGQLLMGLQVNKRYCLIGNVWEHNLPIIDQLNRNSPEIVGCFHSFLKEDISVAVCVKEDDRTDLYAGLAALFVALFNCRDSSREIKFLLLEHQEDKSVVEGFQGIPHLRIFFFETDGDSFFLNHCEYLYYNDSSI